MEDHPETTLRRGHVDLGDLVQPPKNQHGEVLSSPYNEDTKMHTNTGINIKNDSERF